MILNVKTLPKMAGFSFCYELTIHVSLDDTIKSTRYHYCSMAIKLTSIYHTFSAKA
jgi:hypothetical protein